jgi:hypothetical protein
MRGRGDGARARTLSRRARGAQAVQHNLVPFEGETRWREIFEGAGAPMDLEDASAQTAPEVVVMCLTGHFIAWRLTRELNGREPLGLHEGGDGAVHGSDAESLDVVATGLEDLVWAKRPPRIREHLTDRLALTCSTFHSQ